jgi:hypothetical protein
MLARLKEQERGAVMVMAAVSLTILLLFAGLALDFGRAHLLRAQLQTAVDAAALAGALQVQPMAEIAVDRWKATESSCWDPTSERNYPCLSWESTSPARATGRQFDLFHQGGWRSAIAAQCSWPYRCGNTYRIVREWLILPPSTQSVTEQAFYMNATWPPGPLGAAVHDLHVATNPTTAEVTATATLSTPTSFLKLVGISQLQFTRTGTAIPVRR